jgi:sugar lactone lactonase YvrE
VSVTNQAITTIAGNGTSGYSGDGGQASAAELNSPRDMIVDSSGNIYIADTNNNVVRKVATNGVITTIAGNSSGLSGYTGDGGQATSAKLNDPQELAIDSSGNLYIADLLNAAVRKVATTGVITTIAGTGTASNVESDGGQATSSTLDTP